MPRWLTMDILFRLLRLLPISTGDGHYYHRVWWRCLSSVRSIKTSFSAVRRTRAEEICKVVFTVVGGVFPLFVGS